MDEDDPNVAARFLYAVSGDPQGHAAIILGEHQYSASVMAYHAENPDAYQVDPEQKMLEISRTTGYIDGIAANAKSDEIINQGLKNDKQYNEALATGGKWAESLISVGGAAVGGGTGGPAGAAMGAAVAQEAAKFVIGETIEAAKQDTTEEKSWEAGTQYSISEGKTHDHVKNAMKGARGATTGNDRA